MSQIRTNIEFVKEEIKKTLNKCERNDDVTLIAVSKTVGVEQIDEALDSGIENLGENKVQEVEKKHPNVSKKAIWHLIGTLQTNKVKYIIKTIDLIHSLDRIPLAKEIDKRAKENDLIMDCLVQVNISLEDSKHGLLAEDVEAFVKEVSLNYNNIRILGLMGMAPFEAEPEQTRPYFKKLKSLFDELSSLSLENVEMKYLSMGMTNDYKIAIEEGSNMIRVGTGIFGERNYV